MECEGCGAALEADDLACRYCRRATPWARERQAEERAREAQAAAAREAARALQAAAARDEVTRLSKRTLVVALVGMVTCLLPIAGAFAIAWYLRVKKLARAAGVDVPGSATAGAIISAIGLVGSPLFVVWAIQRDNAQRARTDARIQVLEGTVDKGALAPVLDFATACGLAELQALKTGMGGEVGKNLVRFDCGGALGGTPARPVLDPFSASSEVNDKRFVVAACFDRGSRWFVKELSVTRTCGP